MKRIVYSLSFLVVALSAVAAFPVLGWQQGTAVSPESILEWHKAELRRSLAERPAAKLFLTVEAVSIRDGIVNVHGSSGIRREAHSELGPAGGVSWPGLETGRADLQVAVGSIDSAGAQTRFVVSRSGSVALDRELTFMGNEEVLIELAQSADSTTQLALRLRPQLERTKAVREYPFLLNNFETRHSVVILDRQTVVDQGSGGRAAIPEGVSGAVQALSVSVEGVGSLLVSYRPFEGSTRAGYFDGRHLAVDWEGRLLDWYSIDQPFLPEGRWAAYVQASTDERGRSVGIQTVPLVE